MLVLMQLWIIYFFLNIHVEFADTVALNYLYA